MSFELGIRIFAIVAGSIAFGVDIWKHDSLHALGSIFFVLAFVCFLIRGLKP